MSEDPAIWYHGTRRERSAGIARSGLHARYCGRDYQGFGVAYHVLARDRHQALLPEIDTLVAIRILDHEAADYLTCLADGDCWCRGLMSGLLKPLPPRMIIAIEDAGAPPNNRA